MRKRRRNDNTVEGIPLLKSQDMQDLYNIELEILGDRLRRARQDKKISQRDLSEGLFTSAYLSSLELGKTRPTADSLAELARRLDKSIEYFLRPANGLLNGNQAADEDYLRVLRARQNLWLAQVATERARTQATLGANTIQTDLPLPLLQEADRQSTRLSEIERGQYSYIAGRYATLTETDGSDQAFSLLEEGLKQIEQAQLNTSRQTDRQQATELKVLMQTEIGDLYLDQGRPMQALSQFQTGLEELASLNLGATLQDPVETPPATEKLLPDRLRWRLLARVAHCYARLNDKEQTLQALRQAVQTINGVAQTDLETVVIIKAGPVLSQVDKLIELTDIYYEQARRLSESSDFQQASLKVGRCLQLLEQAQDGVELVNIYTGLAERELEAGQYGLAESQVRQLLNWLDNTGPSYGSQKLKALLTLAQARYKQGDSEEAIKTIEQALNLLPSTQTDVTVETARLYQTAAEIQARLGHKNEAISYYQKALAALPSTMSQTKNVFSTEVADIYYSYGQQLREWGDVEQAFEFLEKAYQFRQSR